MGLEKSYYMKRFLSLFVLFGLLLFLGCVSSPPANNSSSSNTIGVSTNTPSVIESYSPTIAAAGDHVEFCTTGTSQENEECFEEQFDDCSRAVGVFWKTMDGYPLMFESQGLDEETGKCLVHVDVHDDQSQFFGQYANCLVGKVPSESGELHYDVYSLGTETCTGSYVSAMQKDTTPTAVSEPTPVTSTPAEKSFSILANDNGVVGEKNFTVKKGDVVHLTIAIDTHSISFGGEWVRAPSGPKLADESKYVFTSGDLSPGSSKVVTFTAEKTFQYAVYWPGTNVLKGTGTFTVEE